MSKIKVYLFLLVIIFLSLFLIGCKTQKYNTLKETSFKDSLFVYEVHYCDTVIIESIHVHYECDYLCSWIVADTLIDNDTLKLKMKNYVR